MTNESTIYVVYTDEPIKAFTNERLADEYSRRVGGRVQVVGLRIESTEEWTDQ